MASHFFPDIEGDVASIFLSYFQRAPEFEAMQHYAGVYQALQADPATAGNAFNLLAAHIYADGVTSDEVPAGPTVTNSWYVTYLYSNILGRAPDAEGHQYWVAQLASGAIERAELVGTFIAAALAAGGNDEAYVTNRTEVAVVFSQWENSNPQVLPNLKYNAAEVLIGVNENPETVLSALDRMESHTGQIGETKNLTTGIDTFEGTTANDTFNAVFQNDLSSTLTNFDSINGNLGFDTFNIYVADGEDAANANFPSTATVRNVELVNVFNGGNSHDTLRNVSNYEGVEEFWQLNTAADVMGVGEGVTVGFARMQQLGEWEDFLGVTLQNGVNTASIELAGVGAANNALFLEVAGRNLTTVEIDGLLAHASTELLLDVVAGKGVNSLTISTAVDTDLFVKTNPASAANLRINTLDLSGSTGDIWFWIGEDQAAQLAGPNSALNVTFGSGDDTIIFEARDLTLRDNIDGGDGYDTVALTQNGRLQTQNYDTIDRLQNIDQLVFLGHNVDLNAALLADFDLTLAGTGMATVHNLAADQDLTVSTQDCGCLYPGLVVLQNAAADVTVTLDGVGIMLMIGNTVGARNGSLVLDGEGFVAFDNSTSGKFAIIDASELEGYDLADLEEGDMPHLEALGLSGPGDDVTLGLVLVSVSFTPAGEDEVEIAFNGSGMSGAVAETVLLNVDNEDIIALNVDLMEAMPGSRPWDTSNSSTYGRMDVIENFNSSASAGPLDYLLGPGSLGRIQLNAGDNTLQLAFQTAAEAYATSEADVIYFMFDGDTYLYADTLGGDSGQYDNSDFALKIVGEHNLATQWISPVVEL